MPAISPATNPLPSPDGLSPVVKTKDVAAVLPVIVGEVPEAGVGEKAGSSNNIYNNYLKIFRSNPEALTEIFQKGQEVFNHPTLNRSFPEAAKNALGNVSRIIDALTCSPKSLANTLFLKDYVAKLGLSLEGDWLDFLQQNGDKQRPAESLKSALLKLTGELTGLLKESSSLAPEESRKLTRLAGFTEISLRAIETQQMVNVASQENDNKYLLQIPLLFPEGVRNGEIFIDLGKNGPGGEGKNKKLHVVMFLNMDKLGDMVVDASLNDKKMACVFKFTDPEAQGFFAPFLPGLGDALRQIGYGCDSLTSMVTADSTMIRQDCHREMFNEQDVVNLFA